MKKFFVVQNHSRAPNDRRERIIHNGNGKAGDLPQKNIDVLEENAPTHQHDTFVHNICGQFQGSLFEGAPNRVDDRVNRLSQRLPDLFTVDLEGLGGCP